MSAGIGASWSSKWSGMNIVEYPESSSFLAFSTNFSRERALETCAPNRNGFIIAPTLFGFGEPVDGDAERDRPEPGDDGQLDERRQAPSVPCHAGVQRVHQRGRCVEVREDRPPHRVHRVAQGVDLREN